MHRRQRKPEGAWCYVVRQTPDWRARLLAPSLTLAHLATTQQRTAKLLQNLASGVVFGEKESYMEEFNGFIEQHLPTITAYFDLVGVRAGALMWFGWIDSPVCVFCSNPQLPRNERRREAAPVLAARAPARAPVPAARAPAPARVRRRRRQAAALLRWPRTTRCTCRGCIASWSTTEHRSRQRCARPVTKPAIDS